MIFLLLTAVFGFIVYDQNPSIVGVDSSMEKASFHIMRLEQFIKSGVILNLNERIEKDGYTFYRWEDHISCLPEIGLGVDQLHQKASSLKQAYDSVFDSKGRLKEVASDRILVQKSPARVDEEGRFQKGIFKRKNIELVFDSEDRSKEVSTQPVPLSYCLSESRKSLSKSRQKRDNYSRWIEFFKDFTCLYSINPGETFEEKFKTEIDAFEKLTLGEQTKLQGRYDRILNIAKTLSERTVQNQLYLIKLGERLLWGAVSLNLIDKSEVEALLRSNDLNELMQQMKTLWQPKKTEFKGYGNDQSCIPGTIKWVLPLRGTIAGKMGSNWRISLFENEKPKEQFFDSFELETALCLKETENKILEQQKGLLDSTLSEVNILLNRISSFISNTHKKKETKIDASNEYERISWLQDREAKKEREYQERIALYRKEYRQRNEEQRKLFLAKRPVAHKQ